MKKYQTTKSGFSLIESLVAIFIFSLMAAMMAGSFSAFFKTYVSAKKSQRSAESAQYVMNLMTKTIRNSTFDTLPIVSLTEIKMFDNQRVACVDYKYEAGLLKTALVSGPSITGIESCATWVPAVGDFSNLTNAGEILGVTFTGEASVEGESAGKILISVTPQGTSASQIQTTVSLRDTKYVAPIQQIATPSANPAGGSYASSQSVTLSTSTSGATIHYTTNGTNPTAASPTYSSAIAVNATTTIKAIAVKSGMTDSAVMNETYTIGAVVATPTASPSGGSYSLAQSVTLSVSTSGATIHYTTNGTNPTATSPTYSSAIVVNTTTTIKAIAVKSGMVDSAVMNATYTIDTNWITIAQCPGIAIYKSDASSIKQWKSVNTACVSPDCELGIDSTYPASRSLIWSETLPSAYSAQEDCLQNYFVDARLPTMTELQCIYDNWSNYEANGSGPFQYEGYWSATEYGSTTARYIDFSDGYSDRLSKTTTLNVRCVRN